jgi:PmbA protein
MQVEQQQLENIAQKIFDYSKKYGATNAEVTASISTGFSVESRAGQVDTVEHNHDKQIHITVYRDQASGDVSTSDTRTESLEQAVQMACEIAKYTEQDLASGLAEKSLMATEFYDLDLYHPWGITPEQAIEKTIECEAIARDYDKRITNSDGVSLSTHADVGLYANSHGFIGYQHETRHDMSCVMVAEQAGIMQRDYQYTTVRDPQNLMNIKKLAHQAAQNTIARLGSKPVKTQTVPVIFRHDVARGLLSHFSSAIRGGALHRKASFLIDSLEKQIFPEWLSLEEQPYILQGMASSCFDADGVQTQKKYFIENGVLKNYSLDVYSAKKLAMQTTGNAGGIYNLVTTLSDKSFDDLVKQMGTGLIVTEVMGQGVNITTGNYSRGASGFWVENGVIQFPVSEITIAGNLQDMFKSIIAIANDVDIRGSIRTGSILVEKMTIAGC